MDAYLLHVYYATDLGEYSPHLQVERETSHVLLNPLIRLSRVLRKEKEGHHQTCTQDERLMID